MRFFRFPSIIRHLYPYALFRIEDTEKRVYLTFDDGPTPGITGKLVKILSENSVPATFFCTGKKIEDSREDFKLLIKEGFNIANHGYNHLKGWATPTREYIYDIKKGAEVSGSNLFRPPYGSLRFSQGRKLSRDQNVIIWDLMLYDFDKAMTDDMILNIVKAKVRPGSIIVLHDNYNSNSPRFLSKLIDILTEMDYSFGELDKKVAAI